MLSPVAAGNDGDGLWNKSLPWREGSHPERLRSGRQRVGVVSMQLKVHTEVNADPRVGECLQLIRGFAETIFSYVEETTGKKMNKSAASATDHLESALRTRIEGMVNDHVSKAVGTMVAAHPQGAAVSYTLRFPERRRHLLRMLTCAFSDLVATADDGLRHQHPKILLDGFEQWTNKVLGGAYFADANQRALDALGQATNEENADCDQAVWERLTNDPSTTRAYYAVAIPLLMHFSYDFEKTRVEMQRIISSSTNGVVALTAEQWSILFRRLFMPLFRRLSLREEQARIDEQFSEGTAVKLARVYSEYKKWMKANHISEPRDELSPCAPAKV